MIRYRKQSTWWTGGALVLALSVWNVLQGQGVAASLRLDKKTIPLKPSISFIRASFLTGELRDLRVIERVEHGTGKTVGEPVLRATLTLTNDSENQSAHLVGGKIEYIDTEGRHIRVSQTAFPFIGMPSDRLDPGKHTSQVVEVPYPPAAFQPNGIGEVRLKLIYLPIPYRQDTVNIPVYLGG